jgi:hypothetical protein
VGLLSSLRLGLLVSILLSSALLCRAWLETDSATDRSVTVGLLLAGGKALAVAELIGGVVTCVVSGNVAGTVLMLSTSSLSTRYIFCTTGLAGCEYTAENKPAPIATETNQSSVTQDKSARTQGIETGPRGCDCERRGRRGQLNANGRGSVRCGRDAPCASDLTGNAFSSTSNVSSGDKAGAYVVPVRTFDRRGRFDALSFTDGSYI